MPIIYGLTVSDDVYQLSKRKTTAQPPAKRRVAAPAPKRSPLEAKFLLLWRTLHGPELVSEYQFHPTRRWRADFYHERSRTLIEIDGGLWQQGRHNRAQGYSRDCEKCNAAVLLGYRVLRLTSEQLTPDYIGRIIEFVRGNQ